MRYLMLFCYLTYQLICLPKPVYAEQKSEQKCPTGQIATTLNLSFPFDRVDMFAQADANTSTITIFPATLSQNICWMPDHKVMVRKAKSESWFEVLLDAKGKKTGIAARQ